MDIRGVSSQIAKRILNLTSHRLDPLESVSYWHMHTNPLGQGELSKHDNLI